LENQYNSATTSSRVVEYYTQEEWRNQAGLHSIHKNKEEAKIQKQSSQ